MSTTSKKEGPKLTARDLEIAGLVWQCFKTEPQIDYTKLAELANFKNPASASACWTPIKKKLIGDNVIPKSENATARGAKSTKKAKGVSEGEQDDDDDDAETASPTKAKGKSKGKAANASLKKRTKKEVDVEDETKTSESDDESDKKRVKTEKNESDDFQLEA